MCAARSLAGNFLCGLARGRGTYTAEGITKLCEAVKGSSITSLKYAAPLPQKRLLPFQRPLTCILTAPSLAVSLATRSD